MARFLTLILMIVLHACAPMAFAPPVGMVQSWDLYTAVQDLDVDGGQVYQRTTVPQSPFVAQQHAQMSNSTADTYLNITIDGHNLSLVVLPQHYCEKIATILPICLSAGMLFLEPIVDVQLNVTGSYTYHLGGDPIDFDAEVRVYDVTANLLGFAVTYNIDSFLDPSDDTLSFNAAALLVAGHRYRVSYNFESDVAGSLPAIGAVVSGSGGILIEAHPVPEPRAIGILAFVALLTRKRKGSPR